MHRITQLPSGVRVTTAEMPHMESVTVGVWVGVGGRYEPARLSGIAHFIEHLLFKGTRRRNARQISQTVEGIGGYLNAFTGEETTCYYAKASHRHLDTLLDVLTDMVQHPRFAAADIDKERGVIKEELLMYRDQPDHYVHELLTETLWPEHPLGRSLTGTPQTLDAMDRRAFLDFKQKKYVAANTVVAVAGHCEHDDIVKRVQKWLELSRNGRSPQFEPARTVQRSPRLRFYTKNCEQSHLAIGIRGYSRHDERRYALKLLSVILGENMSSRLFQVIREQHGLAYSVQSSTSYFDDTGAVVVSAGLDTKRLQRALKLILAEMRKISKQPPSALELQRAKDYAIGQMRLGLESTSNRMMWLGEHLLAYGFIPTPEEIEKRMAGVTLEGVQEVASELFRDHRLNVAVVTPSKDERAIRDLSTFS
ncbi:MAG TPA: pitrilysin family protein [Verrucomicrobiae bacterium]|nr:pitrilysin family protein [Verrucomicrobiae bacterium]